MLGVLRLDYYTQIPSIKTLKQPFWQT